MWKFFCSTLLVGSLSLTALDSQAKDKVDLKEMKSKYERPSSIPFPDDNPYTKDKALLGKILYFDPRFSASGTQSCATCHNPALSWGDGMALGTGHGHKKLGRKTPTVLNLAWDELYMWDGRKDSLEDQALGPIQAGVEMNMPIESLISKVKSIKGYAPLFKAAFPEDNGNITPENIAKAIATYERTVVSAKAPFDHWIEGKENSMSESAKRGFVLFNTKANCAACHSGWNFSDSSFHDIGLKSEDIGRGEHVPIPSMKYAFKTVGLRNIDRRGPYMHDGSLPDLMAVVNHYDSGFIQRESLSSDIKKLGLTEDEKKDLVEFLHSLTSKDKAVTIPELPM